MSPLSVCIAHSLAVANPLHASSLPANVNFDPLGLASFPFPPFGTTAEERLAAYRGAELRHGRLAMLAAVAYPVQETANPILSRALHLPSLLPEGGVSPSLPNGGLTAADLIFFLGAAAAVEAQGKASLSADAGWRVTEVEEGSEAFFNLQSGEVWNGRVAMVAVAGYVAQEWATRVPVLGPSALA